MRRTLIAISALSAGMLGSLSPAAEMEPRTFELNSGRFTEVPTTNPASLPKPDPDLKRIESLIDRREFGAARKQVLPWLLANRGQPNYDLGLYLMAQAENGAGDPLIAFYYCDELLDTFPASVHYPAAVDLQYSIGDSLFNGRKLKFLGMGLISGTEEAVEIMFRIQQRSPGSPLAERALRRTADYYFANADFDLAADAYGAHAKSYPRAPNLPEILLRQAFSNYAQFTGARFDPTPLANARAQMVELINKYPEIAQRENIQSFVDSIDKTLARKLLLTADFYRRTDKPAAEKFTLQTLVKQYPQTDEAQQAKAMLGQT
ncbi:MAG: outer membrane protein assembly factor BamD [Burkholderiales bacterium]|nr:outer membrane protein assembly factor BamD [Phycisphaerae bacterium]